MTTGHRLALRFALFAVGVTCYGQDVKVPFAELLQKSQLSSSLALREPDSSIAYLSASAPPMYVASVPAPRHAPRVFSKSFFLLNGLHLGMAVFDVEMTQRCIASHQCSEGNPLMPSSQAGQLGVNFALVGYSSFVSYRMKRSHMKAWWIAPVTGSLAHAVGVGTGFAHQ